MEHELQGPRGSLGALREKLQSETPRVPIPSPLRTQGTGRRSSKGANPAAQGNRSLALPLSYQRWFTPLGSKGNTAFGCWTRGNVWNRGGGLGARKYTPGNGTHVRNGPAGMGNMPGMVPWGTSLKCGGLVVYPWFMSPKPKGPPGLSSGDPSAPISPWGWALWGPRALFSLCGLGPIGPKGILTSAETVTWDWGWA